MKRLFKLIRAKTPKIGRKLLNRGLGLIGLSMATETVRQTGIGLPDVPESWIILAEILLAIIGLIMTGAGAASTTEDPDKL